MKGFFGSCTRRTICICLSLAMLVSAVSLLTLGAESEPVVIVIFARDIKRGTKLTAEDVTTKTLTSSKNLPSNVITDTAEVIGKYSTTFLYEGEYAYSEKLSKTAVSKKEEEKPLAVAKSRKKFVSVTEYVSPNTGKDLTAALQGIIDKNPNSTIFFPDGEYLISAPLLTPADSLFSVTLHFSSGAVLKAMSSFRGVDGHDGMICVGGTNRKFDIWEAGSYYAVIGGTIDANGRTNGIVMESGRETMYKNILIKNARTGIYVDKATEYGSSDADFDDITIIGSGALGTKGIWIKGFDNTVTNLKVYNCEIGAQFDGGGTLVRNVHIYYDYGSPALSKLDKKYESTVGILENEHGNFFFDCTTENVATGFKFKGYLTAFDSCRAIWDRNTPLQVAFMATNYFETMLPNCRAEFFGSSAQAEFLRCAIYGGSGVILNPAMNEKLVDTDTHKRFIPAGTGIQPIS